MPLDEAIGRRFLASNRSFMALRVALFVGSAVALVLSAQSASADPASALPADLVQFKAARPGMARALSEPIAACVAREDTDNPAFHGCVDWHSAVHGTWALTSYTWATGDRRYRAVIANILQPALLARERKHLDDDPTFEMPYGRAWFLRLAIDYRKTFHSELLTAFADDVASSLMEHYSAVAPDPRTPAYQNASWALINLYDYGISRRDSRLVEFVKGKVRQYYLMDSPCPIDSAEIEPGEFMAICTNWAWLVQKVLPRDEFGDWLARFMPQGFPLDPIVTLTSVHQVGLDFSRTWGLWNLYRATGEPRFLSAYLANFNATYTHPEMWRGEYRTVGHWVAQFGMLGLMVTYYDWPTSG